MYKAASDKKITNQAVGTGNKKFFLFCFLSFFLLFFYSSIALQPLFGPWLSRSSSSNLLSSLLSPSSILKLFLPKFTGTQILTFRQNIDICVFILFLWVQYFYLYLHWGCILKSGVLFPQAILKFFRAASGPRAIFWLFCSKLVAK